MTQAWGDGILHNLSARGKALYSIGRFVRAGSEGVQFALPNTAHRDKCMQLASEVEAALTAHFRTPVTLVLVVDPGLDASPSREAPPAPSTGGVPPAAGDAHLDEVDPEEFKVAPPAEDHQASAVDRLLQAFPGASEVEE